MTDNKKFYLKATSANQSSNIFTQDQIIELVSYVNAYRARNQANPLTWNATIALFSQNWANYLIKNNLFQHSGNSFYGENLAWFQGYQSDMMTMTKTAIDSWYNEILSYNFNNPGFSESTGHFTNLVWLSSTEFGMGYGYNSTTDTVIVTYNNSPPGNILDEFKINVLPSIINVPLPVPITNPIPTPTVISNNNTSSTNTTTSTPITSASNTNKPTVIHIKHATFTNPTSNNISSPTSTITAPATTTTPTVYAKYATHITPTGKIKGIARNPVKK
jgi:hypothetical protein